MKSAEQLKGAVKNIAKQKNISPQAVYGKMNIPMKIDITTGDVIIPGEIVYDFPLVFEGRSVEVLAYTLETVLAEKYETIIRRGTANTRARDYYDLYLLHKIYANTINLEYLRRAVALTSQKRGSESDIKDAEEVLTEIQDSQTMKKLWEKYRKENLYARDVSFDSVIKCARKMDAMLQSKESGGKERRLCH